MITSLYLFIKPLWTEDWRLILIKIKCIVFSCWDFKEIEMTRLCYAVLQSLCLDSQPVLWFLFCALYMWVVMDGWCPLLCKEKWGYLSSSSGCEVARLISVLVFMSLCFTCENRRLCKGLWQSCSDSSLHLKFQSWSKPVSGKKHLSH